MTRIDEYKEIYDVLIPSDYDSLISKAIQIGKKTIKRKKRVLRLGIGSLVACYVLALNFVPTFGNAMMQIPLIKEISSIFYFVEVKDATNHALVDIEAPMIQNTGNTALEKKVNHEIQRYIDETVEQTKLEAMEAAKIFEEAQGHTAKAMKVIVSYEIHYQSSSYVSFEIYKQTEMNGMMKESKVWNLDLESGEVVSLKQLLGNGYEEDVNLQIQEQMQKQMAENSEIVYFEGDMGFQGVNDQSKFYIDETGHIVIVFDPYEIAPGSMGTICFQLKQRMT